LPRLPHVVGQTDSRRPELLRLHRCHAEGRDRGPRLPDQGHAARRPPLQIQFRQQSRHGLSLTASYTYGRARTDRYAVGASNQAHYVTLPNKRLNWGPTAYDLRHNFFAYGTYELPFGRGRRFGIDNDVLDQAFGGWSLSGVLRVQSGRPFLLTSGRQTYNQNDAGVVLKGITVKELQRLVKVRPGPAATVFFLDERLIGPDGRADPALLAPPTTPGELGEFVYLYGPGLWNVDLALSKRFRLPREISLSVEALMINAFNHPNFVVGATGGASVSIDSTTFGRTSTTAAGNREVQFRLQLSF
jgi:hypothetical protein